MNSFKLEEELVEEFRSLMIDAHEKSGRQINKSYNDGYYSGRASAFVEAMSIVQQTIKHEKRERIHEDDKYEL